LVRAEGYAPLPSPAHQDQRTVRAWLATLAGRTADSPEPGAGGGETP
jgi:hypothetical protein